MEEESQIHASLSVEYRQPLQHGEIRMKSMAEDRESIKRTEASVTRFDSEFHAWPKEYPPMPRNELPKHLTNMAAKHCGTTPYCDVSPIVRIFESEICAMARSAVEWGEKETGGGLYGA